MNFMWKITQILKIFDGQIVSNERNKNVFSGFRIGKIKVFFVFEILKNELNNYDFSSSFEGK